MPEIAEPWTSEEDEILVQGFASYSSDSKILLYAKIASKLENKSVRDVAKRYVWMKNRNKNVKRRKQDHNGLGSTKVDNKKIIDMVVASQVFVPSQHEVINNDLLKQNMQWFSQISANFTSSSLMDNVNLFNKIRKNINIFEDNLNENVTETLKRMPALPEKLNDELFCAVYRSYHE